MLERKRAPQPRVARSGAVSAAMLFATALSAAAAPAPGAVQHARAFADAVSRAVRSALPDARALARRRAAHLRDLKAMPGPRDTRNVALDDVLTGSPLGAPSAAASAPLDGIDGDPDTAWRGAAGTGPWLFTLPFSRPVHVALVRALYGDNAALGVPSAYRWEYQRSASGRCEPGAEWTGVPGGAMDDRHPNTFVHGPRDVHALRHSLFTDIDACALRLSIAASEGASGPVLREIAVHEAARSLTLDAGVRVTASSARPAVAPASPGAILDGAYESFWSGEAGRAPWTATIDLGRPRTIDRIGLVLGYDAVTVPLGGRTGRRLTGAYMPLRYAVETAERGDDGWEPVREAAPPQLDGEPLPVRRRLVHLGSPRRARLVRLTILEATGPWGESDPTVAAPVVRDITLYQAGDMRPVIREPWFLSVDANPSGLTHALKGGEAYTNGGFARDLHQRLRRAIVGFDADTRWPADASRPRDAGTGRSLEAMCGDDPRLDRRMLEAAFPPPVVVLSGSLDWEFGEPTGPSGGKPGHWTWNALARASEPGRGMGQLREALERRSAPFLGLCGGAQILAVLEAARRLEESGAAGSAALSAQAVYDRVLARNDNRPVRGLVERKDLYEHAWWFDPPKDDAARPTIRFDPSDRLFEGLGGAGRARSSTRELASSHGDMVRVSALAELLPGYAIVAWSEYCRAFVDGAGPERTWQEASAPGARCVRIPQAFRSVDGGFPVVGLQFHPEQRDLVRLAPGSAAEARGDAMNVMANAVDLVIERFLAGLWPHS
jgi:hypothetical protein